MSETPETDAFFFRIDIDWDMEVEFARKLERERDEARQRASDLAAEHMLTMNKLAEERDEARNGREAYKQLAIKHAQERDEAREIAGRLAHFLERPAYSVDEAIARMEALNSYKKQKSQ